MINARNLWLPALLVLILAAAQAASPMEFTQARDRDQIELESRLSLDFATPHLAWAKPLPGGPLRALFLIHVTDPGTNVREVVELLQRFDLKADVAYEKDGILYGSSAQAERLLDLLKTPYHVIVIGNCSLDVLPYPVQYELLKQVANGAGLVSIGPRVKVMTDDRALPDLPDALTLGTGLAALVGKRADSQDLARQIFTCYALRKGRGLHVNYSPIANLRSAALTPTDPFTWSALAKYEHWSAFIGRAILWAAGRDLSAGILELPAEGRSLSAGAPHTLLAASLDPAICAGSNWTASLCRLSDGLRLPLETNLSRAAAALRLRVALPALRADDYMLELRASSRNRALACAAVPLRVTSRARVASLTLSRDFLEPGESLEAAAALEGSLQPNDLLLLRARDSYGRLLWQTQMPASLARPVTVTALPAFSLWMRLEAALLRDGVELSCAIAEFKITRRNRDHYAMVMWDVPTDVLGYYGVQRMNQAGFNVNLLGGNPANTIAAFGWSQIPYTTRILDNYDEHGRMLPFSWNDEQAVRDHVTQHAQRYLPSRKHGVYVYSLGDETTTQGASTDPSDLAAYRDWLRGQYHDDVAALNASWQSSYSSFDEVDLIGYGSMHGRDLAFERAALDKGLTARWFDRQAFAKHNYLRFCARFGQAYKSIDPKALTGFEGAGGILEDIQAIVTTNGFWSPYYSPGDEVLRSLAPPTYPHSNWIGYEHTPTPILANAIRTVSNGCTSLFWWRWDNIGQFMGFLNSDLDYFPTTKELVKEMYPVRYGIGDWYIRAQRQHDRIAVFHSLPAALAPFALEDVFDEQFDMAHRSLQALLEDLGLQYNYLTESQILDGILDSGQYKVLILAQTYALNPQAAQAIIDFSRNGGAVIADVVPGRLDHHCAPLPQPSLAPLFGPGKPGVLLQGDLTGYERPSGDAVDERDTELGAALRAQLSDALARAGVRCPVIVKRLDDADPVRVELVRWRSGDLELLALFHYPIGFYDAAPPVAPARLALRLDQPRYLHRIGAPLGDAAKPTDSVQLELPAGRMAFFISSPLPLSPLKVAVGAPDADNVAPVVLTAPDLQRRTVHLAALDAQGTVLPWFDKVVLLDQGALRLNLYLALDRDPSLAALRVTDWFTGSVQTVPVNFAQP